jgi:hypothetical protein
MNTDKHGLETKGLLAFIRVHLRLKSNSSRHLTVAAWYREVLLSVPAAIENNDWTTFSSLLIARRSICGRRAL